MRVVAIIPAYNEAASIYGVVEETRKYVDDVVVVDDGSGDNTSAVAEQAGARTLRQPRNMGKGKALQAGMDHAVLSEYDAAIFLDADGQHDPTSIPSLRDPLDRGVADMAVGSRKAEWATRMPLPNRLTNKFMSWLLSLVAGQPMEDTQCGYRIIHTRVLRTVRMDSSHFEAESEFLLKAARHGFRIAWVPIRSIYGLRPTHIRPLRDSILFFKMLVRVLRNSHVAKE